MKILIVAENIGGNAPGIVFEKLIYGLSKHHEIVVITQYYDPSIFPESNNIKLSQVKNIHVDSRIKKLFISVLGIDPVDLYWAYKVNKYIKTFKSCSHDLIFSFVSFGHYAALIAGENMSITIGCKHISYLVDAIPAPIGWLKNGFYYRGLRSMMRRYLTRLDAIFSSNHYMLKYQMNMVDFKINMLTGIIHNPNMGSFAKYSRAVNEANVFVYTGGVYGPRKPDFVIDGFIKLLSIYPDSKLIFVGTEISSYALTSVNEQDKSKIEIHPFTTDLTYYYSIATALIDIDSVLKDDVFLSSKIVNYISINRIIISETGLNSPSRHIFKGIESIIQCNHDSDDIYKAMMKSIELKNTISYDDRREVQKQFGIEEVVNNLNIELEKIIAV